MVTQASQWKSTTKVGEHEIVLPSGNTALLRAVQAEAFLESGMIPDALNGMVQSAINSKKGLPPTALKQIQQDPKKMAAALEVFDRVLVYCVVEPQVEMPPVCIHPTGAINKDTNEPETCGLMYSQTDVHINRQAQGYHKYVEDERDSEVLYADMVDMNDKTFIFQWAVGGVADLGKFREQLAASVESVQDGQDVLEPTK